MASYNKDIEPEELKKAICLVVDQGYYHSEYIAGKLVSVIQSPAGYKWYDGGDQRAGTPLY